MAPIRVMLADDHSLFRQGVAKLLAAESDFAVVGEAGDGQQALEMARELRPDIILMDVSMPVMDGLAATRRIKAEAPGVRIVILTVSDGEHSLFEAFGCGASGFLPKVIAPQALCDTLRRVFRGEAPVSRAMAARLLEGFARRARHPGPVSSPAAGLTLREKEVLEHVAEGGSYAEIGAALAIAEGTVRDHLKHVLDKLHFDDRAQGAAPVAR